MILLDRPTDLERANVEVELRDTGLADAPMRVIASMRSHISGRAVSQIKFRLDAIVQRDRDYTLGAEVRRGSRLAPHDLLNVASHRWRAGDPNPVFIKVQSIM